MNRHNEDWIKAFMDYASFGEAPRHMYFWTAVSTIAGALRRRVWLDQGYFKWYPNFYVIIVAPPGIVSKSTTAGIGMDLLRKVKGVHMGPSVVTMQALLTAMAEITEGVEFVPGEFKMVSELTIESSEFGNLLNPNDKDMVDMLVNLWDCKEGALEKKTKHSGNDTVENPFLNIIACTTPAWIAGNFPEYMIGGGFTSRCIFVYADKKAKYVAYPGLDVPPDMAETASKLVEDLTAISQMKGRFNMTRNAVIWGKAWYEKLYRERPPNLDDARFGGYVARKQSHLHKLAMVMSASMSGDMQITDEILSVADTMLADLEPDMAMVFSKIGKTEQSVYIDRMVELVARHGRLPYAEVYRTVHAYFPSMRDFEDLLAGCVKAGLLRLEQTGSGYFIASGRG
jgi:hypothetical protein